MVKMEEETSSMIMAALSTLSPQQFSDLTHSLSSHLRHHGRRLTTLLSSPTLFSLALHHLHSLSLPSKTLLISRYLLSTLRLLTHHLQYPILQRHPSAAAITPQDHDALVLLLLLCEVHQHHPTVLHCSTSASPSKSWRLILVNLYSDYSLLTLSGIVTDGVYSGTVLLQFIEIVTRCWKLVGPVIGSCGGGGGKGMEVAASAAAVVALPSVSVRGGHCVVCKEEMEEGRDVCQLPCQHLFHWICILPWLRKSYTCPCCRFQLPTDDLFKEIQRLWDVLMKGLFRYGSVTVNAIQKAFATTEDGFLSVVRKEWKTKPWTASSGSCCLVGIISNGELFIANLGDSRVVLGRSGRGRSISKEITAVQLSSEHNVNVESVRKELKQMDLHDPAVVMHKHNVWRVKGIIQVFKMHW